MQLTRAFCDFFCCNSFSIVVLLVILKLEHPNIYIIHATISSPFIYLFFEYSKDVMQCTLHMVAIINAHTPSPHIVHMMWSIRARTSCGCVVCAQIFILQISMWWLAVLLCFENISLACHCHALYS